MEYTSYYGLFGLLVILLLMLLICAIMVKRRRSLKNAKANCFIDTLYDCSSEWEIPQEVNTYPTPPMPPPPATHGQPTYYHSPSSFNQFSSESTEELNKPNDDEIPPTYEYRPYIPGRSPHQYI